MPLGIQSLKVTDMKVGIIGYGYWGPNLLRNFQANPSFDVVAVADQDEKVRQKLSRERPELRLFEGGEELITEGGVDCVAIATPVQTHYALAKAAMDQGCHVFLEKPMTSTSVEAEDLVARAASCGKTLMVDHTFLFGGPVQLIKQFHDENRLGNVSYIESTRINLGLFQTDVNVLWDLAPHDLSIIEHIFDEEPLHIEASGYCHVNDRIPDICYLTLHFASNKIANLHLSWMSPVKVRRFAIGGSESMLVWDDLDREARIKIYESGISIQPEDDRRVIVPSYRIGDIHCPRVSQHEALAASVSHFANVIGGKTEPIADGRRGLRIVRMLEAADRSLQRGLQHLQKLKAGNAQ